MVEEKPPEEEPLDAALAPSQPDAGHWLEPIYRNHAPVVLQAAFRVTGNAADAEDVLQTVFGRLARRTDPPDFTRGAVGYLRRAATNAALDIVQSRRVKSTSAVPLELLEPADPSPTADQIHYGTELKESLRQALGSLSRRHAEMFVLRYFEGLDNTEIADIFDTSPGTIAVTLHRIRTRLTEELKPLLGGTP
jgi:RNA polymerase sigma-70 factor (ECF subfamily)